MMPDINDALYNATQVEPRGVIPVERNGRLLGEWKTVNANRTKNIAAFRRQLLAFLREIPEDMMVGELIGAVEDAEE